MLKQVGDGNPCAFTKACVNPGPLVRIPGTNLSCCAAHMRLFQILPEIGGGLSAELSAGISLARGVVSAPRSAWVANSWSGKKYL